MAVVEASVTTWEWNRGSPRGKKATPNAAAVFSTTKPSSTADLRIVSLPYDDHLTGVCRYFEDYLSHHGIPSEILRERRHGVNHSFGSHDTGKDGLKATWLEMLCKNIEVGKRTARQYPEEDTYELVGHHMWVHFTFVLLEHCDASGSDSKFTLYCLGLTRELSHHFDGYLVGEDWLKLLDGPFALLTDIFDSVWTIMDNLAWNLAHVFRPIERRTLETASNNEDAAKAIDFAYMHNISKHAIYLTEAFVAVQFLLAYLMEEEQQRTSPLTGAPGTKSGTASFKRCARLFKQTELRITSLERRIANITNLSFNIVTQQDSRVMKRDSASMHTIAIMTLIFLPSSLVATVFGTAFFQFDVSSDGTATEALSSFFWIFWVVAVPLTGAVIVLWFIFNRRRNKKMFA